MTPEDKAKLLRITNMVNNGNYTTKCLGVKQETLSSILLDDLKFVCNLHIAIRESESKKVIPNRD